MERALAMKRVWLLLGVFSAVSVAVGAPLMAISALKLQDVPLAILTLFVLHGVWGMPFYFIAYSRERATLRLLPYISGAVGVSYGELGARVGMTAEGARRIAERALKKGYITLGKNRLILAKNGDKIS